MSSSFELLDYIIFVIYALVILGVGLWVSRPEKGKDKNAEDYFLASKSLPWWAIGASLIAANISAEQFIGMSGSGFALGLAIASYEWMAAITLIIVGKYFLPIFIKKGLYTIPEFVEKRFSKNLKTILAVFWIGLYVFVNLASVMYLGGLALETIIGVKMIYAVIGLALFAAAYSLYGGLSAVAWTDIIQVVFLVLGGLVTTYLALDTVSGGKGVFEGIKYIYQAAPDRFQMILDRNNPEYINLPGIGVLVGGLWVANLYYWGFNQYIIQRTLAAKSLKESQKGILFAAGLKLIIPLIVVIPGIAAYVIVNDPEILLSLGDKAKLNIWGSGFSTFASFEVTQISIYSDNLNSLRSSLPNLSIFEINPNLKFNDFNFINESITSGYKTIEYDTCCNSLNIFLHKSKLTSSASPDKTNCSYLAKKFSFSI